jgi:hypothetical protein
MMNSSFVTRQSGWFVERLKKEAGSSASKQEARAYGLAFGRQPTTAEKAEAEALVRRSGLRSLCWALFNANEFLYVR